MNHAVLPLVVAGALLAACGTSDRGPAAGPTTPLVAQQTPNTSNVAVAPAGPAARQVVDSFIAAGLRAPNPRDNSRNCTGDGGLGCVQLITTDAISVYSWPTETAAQHQADVHGDGAYRKGLIVLSYTGARTPEADRPRYEAVLNRLIGP